VLTLNGTIFILIVILISLMLFQVLYWVEQLMIEDMKKEKGE